VLLVHELRIPLVGDQYSEKSTGENAR
jgi:hypothetical protein